jgi:GAF domain-containing protein
MSRGEIIHGFIKDFPEREQAVLAPQNIQSLVCAPIFAEGRWWGFMGFDECQAERHWSPPEIEALRAAAGILGSALERHRVETALKESEARYRTVFESAPIGIV